MADKQIGIKLNVQSTGLEQVDNALNQISGNLRSMNENVMKQQQRGWGTTAQTKELQEQLRYMQQLLQTTERIARTHGVYSDSFRKMNQEIGAMQRDLGNIPTYRSPVGGWVADRFGSRAGKWVDRIGTGAMIAEGANMLGTLRTGISTGTQLAYGWGDLAKRMNPDVNSLQYGINMSNALQGYGYTDQQILQAATTYGAATGRIDPNAFTKQMQAIEQVGRNYGLDLTGVTQNFAAAYQSGVTGGSTAQLSPQEYANLVANAVNQGNMHGKEMQVMEQLQQLIQMGVSTSGQAGDVKQLEGLLTLINKSGNQGLISNTGTLMQGFNNMIQNPGGGYAGQAFILQALQKAHPEIKNYYKLMDLASQGISDSGNLEAVLGYLSSFTKDKDQQAYILSQMGGGNQHMIRQFLDVAMNPDGTFNQKAIDDFAKNATQNPGDVPQNVTDLYRNREQAKQHAANEAGQQSLQERSWVSQAEGGLLNIFGTAAADVMVGGQILGGLWGLGKGAGLLWRGGKWLGGIGKSVGSKIGSLWSKGIGLFTGGTAAAGEAAAGASAAEVAEAAGTAGALESAGLAADSTGIGLPIGIALGLAGLGVGAYAWWKSKHSSDQQQNVDGKPVQGPPAPGNDAQGQLATGNPTTTGAELAPIVASTIVALGPYMNQLRPYLGSGTSNNNNSSNNSMNNLVYNKDQGYQFNDLVYHPDGQFGIPGLTQVGYFTGGGLPNGPAPNFTGSQADFVQKMLPYAAITSQRTGLPVSFLLAQWGLESGWGTSPAAKENLNFGGIKPWAGAGAGKDSTYAGYTSLSAWANGYADFVTQNSRYAGLLQAARNGASAQQLAYIMGQTGYAEDPNYGSKLASTISAVQRVLQVNGSVNVMLKYPNGESQTVRAPLTADWTGMTL